MTSLEDDLYIHTYALTYVPKRFIEGPCGPKNHIPYKCFFLKSRTSKRKGPMIPKFTQKEEGILDVSSHIFCVNQFFGFENGRFDECRSPPNFVYVNIFRHCTGIGYPQSFPRRDTST